MTIHDLLYKMAKMEAIMDKKTMIEKLVRDAHEKAGFTGTWLYAEKGEHRRVLT